MTSLPVVRMCLVVAALNLWGFSASAAPQPPPQTGGDAEAQKLVTAAMEVDYLKMSFDAAKKKLSQAALTCRRKGCSSGLHASIHGYFAIIHWMGEDAHELAVEDLKNMLKLDLEQKLDVRYSTEEIEDEWEQRRAEVRKVVMEERRIAAAREAEERKAAAAREAEERKIAAAKAAEDARRAEEERKAAAIKAEQDRKAAALKAEQDRKAAVIKAEEDKKAAAAKALEERRAAAAKQAELNKAQAIKDAEEKLARDSAKHADEQRQAVEAQKAEVARKAAEDARRVAEEKKEAERKTAEDTKRAAEDRKEAIRRVAEEKKEAARRAVEDKKEAAQRTADDAKRAADEKKEAARKAEEEKKEAALKAADDAKKTTEEKKEAARKADEERKETARKAEEDRKAAALKAADDAKKTAEEKKEAARKAIEEKKEAVLKAADDAKKAAEEKKEAARKAADDAKKAEEDRRMRVPPPVGKLVENPFKEQAVGYPIPIAVKIPPAPPKIEKPRVEVVKVVAEYSAPGFGAPRQVELKLEKDGEWVGALPCDVTTKDGEVTYYTAAFNKYDNAVARGGSTEKPNTVKVKSELVASLPHWPGALPPESCAETQSKAKAAAQAKCAAGDESCRNPAPVPLCEGNECGGNEVPAGLAANQPKRFGCVSCRVGGGATSPEWEPVGWFALALGLGYRTSARARRRARR